MPDEYDFEELAAKLEFEAGMTRKDAERAADKLLSGRFHMNGKGQVRANWTRAFQSDPLKDHRCKDA